MSAQFDFVWSGRTDTPRSNAYEMFFRLGFDSNYGNGCSGQNARYPALWLTSGSNQLSVSLSEVDSCSMSHVLEYGEIVKGVAYHMEIAFNATTLAVRLKYAAPCSSRLPSRPVYPFLTLAGLTEQFS